MSEETKETTVDYKNTLNLPQTDFPMKANLSQREPNILKKWQTEKLYEAICQKDAAKPKFVLPDGPPYANGNIHMGHALNKILKDMIIKSKRLSGYQAQFIPGWDCHGLPIELNVEKKIGKPGVKVDVKTFRKACREYATSQIALQKESFIRLGILADWERPYLTMDPVFEANIIRSLKQIVANGHLHKGNKPVYWCLDCGSALAEAEVEYKDKQSPTIEAAFTVTDTKHALVQAWQKQGIDVSAASVVIWTTTPWTLPANEAVAVHPDVTYALVRCQLSEKDENAGKTEVYLIAEPLVTSFVESKHIVSHEVLATAPGKALEYLQLKHPFLDKTVPVILADYVTTDAGTGCVHTAPAHGQDDYRVAQHYQLPVESPVNGQGCFIEGTPFVAGLSIYKANGQIIELLRTNGKLVFSGTIQHSYPHCWRHKTPLVFRATPQWFISMSQKGLRDEIKAEVTKVDWIPGWGKARMMGMFSDDRPDWCISRQRTWSTPMGLIVNKDTQALHPDIVSLMDKVADIVEVGGIEAWHELELTTLLGDGAAQYEKVTDTLDVWFDSGVTHDYLQRFRKELAFPADLYLEGSDQYRGWFQSSLLTSVAMKGVAPYKQVLTHGYTVDAQGRKMSKSLGNVVAPEKVINTLGADVLRLWVAAMDYHSEIHVSDEILKRNSEAYRRIRNTLRFLLANAHGFDPKTQQVPVAQLPELDKFIVYRTAQLQREIIADYEHYDFHLIYQKIHNFCIVELGSFYLDIIKDRQYTTLQHGLPRLSAQTVLYHVAEALVRWIAPILSFTAEEVWSYLPGERVSSVHLAEWYTGLPEVKLAAPFDEKGWQTLLSLRDQVNKALEEARAAGHIGSGLEARVVLYVGDVSFKLLTALQDELRFFCITSEASVRPWSARTPAAYVGVNIPELAVEVSPLSYPKCARCWHRRPEVNQIASHPGLCQRCVDNVVGQGETRQYA